MSRQALLDHLASGATTVCRAWTVRREDGLVLGFTDHDLDLLVDGILCRADSGMTARALQQTTGLSVDNSEVYGALSETSITEDDLLAGRFDGAEVSAYLVNWADPGDYIVQFRGSLGEVSRTGGSFKAELRGLSEALNRPHGMAYTPRCSAILGDTRCRFDLAQPGYVSELAIETVEQGRVFVFADFPSFQDRWFEDGVLEVLTGPSAGLVGVIKIDRQEGTARHVELWQSILADMGPGDMIRLTAGCNRTQNHCKVKFANFLNFRGFPHIPGEDWLASYPVPERSGGGSVRAGGSEP